MVIVQLMASPFVGGPERQVLGLAESLPADYQTVFLSFAEGGRCRPFLEEARRQGFEAVALEHKVPRYWHSIREIAAHLRRVRADVLCCNGYKPDILGWRAARRAGVPVVSISHGWTAATLRVRLNEWADRLVLRWMDQVVCVSQAQAARVRGAGVAAEKITVIRNAVHAQSCQKDDPRYREELARLFRRLPAWIIGAAGRLSPEKGFDQFVEAAALVTRQAPEAGFVVFGDGPLREAIQRRIAALGLERAFICAGFRADLRGFLPHLDVVVLPSYTEGLPVVVLEAMAAGLPVVATAVGGTPEVMEDGVTGHLVAPGDPAALADRVLQLLADKAERRRLGTNGRRRVEDEFTFAAQSCAYQRLFARLSGQRFSQSRDRKGAVLCPAPLRSRL